MRAGARLPLRFRMDQQEPVLRRLHADRRAISPNSDLASTGLPRPEELEDPREVQGRDPRRVFTKAYEPPKTDGTGNIRDNLRQALRLLKEAGWTVKGERLVNDQTGQPFEFEFLLDEAGFRAHRPAVRPEPRARRHHDASAHRSIPRNTRIALNNFDFDMIMARVCRESLSPGNEQREFWGSAAADEPGSDNYHRHQEQGDRRLVDLVIARPGPRRAVIASTHALDRVLLCELLSSFPIGTSRISASPTGTSSAEPEDSPPYALDLDSWWVDPARAQDESRRRKQQEPQK